MYTTPEPPQREPALKGEATPLCGLPGAEGWRRRMGQETKDKKERQKEKNGEWAATAEILRLLASRAKRLVLLAPLWLADLGLDAPAWTNFYSGRLYGLISHLTSWQVNRGLWRAIHQINLYINVILMIGAMGFSGVGLLRWIPSEIETNGYNSLQNNLFYNTQVIP